MIPEDVPAISADNAPAGFAELGLRPELLRALSSLGYEEPTPIQQEAIPPLLAGRDLRGQAATGTGKTAAFALPILQRLPVREFDRDAEQSGADRSGPATPPSALVLVPTRELAGQVSQACHRYGRELGVRVAPVYGGAPIGRQLRLLERGVDVVVATPGRALDHLRRGTLRLDELTTVVLDEADEMLDMGFAEDIEAILAQTPPTRQTVLFSATMPARIDGIARAHLRDPVEIQIAREPATGGPAALVHHRAYLVGRPYKPAALTRVLDMEAPAAAVVFCRTREEVDQLTETLGGRGYRAEALHGGMGQEQRNRVMGRLRSGAADLVVATDVAARGLDIPHLTHVVNYNVPSAPDTYVHRVGRVGRAGRAGVAITLVEPREHRLLKTIERVTERSAPLEPLPTVADLRARRLQLVAAGLREHLADPDQLDRFRAVVESLAEEHDLVDIALAAVRLAYEAGGAEPEEQEIPAVPLPGSRGGARHRDREPRTGMPARRGWPDSRPDGHPERRREARQPGRGRDGVTRLFLGVGRRAGVRPQDLVGAIAGESHLSGRDVGAIEIADRFSLVEVPEPAADAVIAALRRATIKGRKATVRRDRSR